MSVDESEVADASTPNDAEDNDGTEVRPSRFGVDAIMHANQPRGLE